MNEPSSALRNQRLRRLWLVIATACGLALLWGRPALAKPAAAQQLRFEPNLGQFAARVRYLARGRSYALFLTPGGATFAFQRAASVGSSESRAIVAMKLRGAAEVEPRGVAKLAGLSNYFQGADPKLWRSGVEAQSRVRYDSVLPGVDVEYYGTDGRELEYDLSLAAGVDPSTLVVEFEGVSRIEVTANGSARLHLADGSVLLKDAPIAYQERAGRRARVAVRYELRSGGLGFVVGERDAALPLVIDPVLSYATYFGGSSFDEATGIAADLAGNTYLVGYTASTLFPTSSPEQPTHGGGSYDAFVVKLDATGQSIVYSTYLGGSGPDIAYAVASDALGNAYVAGLTSSANFPVVSALQAAPGGGQDAFVAKLNATGSALVYSTYLGGAADDYAKGIAVSGAGVAYLVGTTFSANFPKVAALQVNLNGTYDAFVAQVAAAGSSLVYSTFLGGNATENGNAIALDPQGNAYVVGATTSPNFPTANARQAVHGGGGADAFLSKLNANGSAFVFSTYLGGSGTDEAFGVSVAQGTAFVVGSTLSSNFPLGLPLQPVPGGNNHTDAFVSRFDPSGTAFVYSTYLGGTGNDVATAVVSDTFGNAYVVGQTDSVDLPLASPLTGQEAYRGATDAFVSTLAPSGARSVYTTYLGGTAEDRAAGVALGAGKVHVVGITRSSDFPRVTPIINGLVGSQDAFVVKLPQIDAVAAPALSFGAMALLAGALLAVALLLLNARRPTRYRTER